MQRTGPSGHFHINEERIGEKYLLKAVGDGRLIQDDASLVLEYVAERRASRNISIGRENKIIFQIMVWRKFAGPLRTTTIQELYSGVTALMDSDYSQNSKYDTVSIMKPFFQWSNEEGYTQLPEKKLNAIKRPRMDSMTKTAADMLTFEEIARMITVCKNPRDEAMVMSLYEAGERIKELALTTWGRVTFDEYGVIFNTSEKTGKPRYIRLVLSREYLAKWKQKYPVQPVPDDALVFINRSGDMMRYLGFLEQVKRIAKRAGITRRVSPHTFRHSRITHLIQEGVSESVIKLMMWGNISTDMFRTYAHLTSADIDREILNVSGIPAPVRKRTRGLRPVVCPTCQQLNGAVDAFCKVCGTSLTDRAVTSKAGVKSWIKENPEDTLNIIKEIYQEANRGVQVRHDGPE
jgi:site-specific recombinase XerD